MRRLLPCLLGVLAVACAAEVIEQLDRETQSEVLQLLDRERAGRRLWGDGRTPRA